MAEFEQALPVLAGGRCDDTDYITGKGITDHPTGKGITDRLTGKGITDRLTGKGITDRPTGKGITGKGITDRPTGKGMTGKGITSAVETDIGGGKTNQDKYVIWENDPDIKVYAILDGHGSEQNNGEYAAAVAAETIVKILNEQYLRLRVDPYNFLTYIFDEAHKAIKKKLLEGYGVKLVKKGKEHEIYETNKKNKEDKNDEYLIQQKFSSFGIVNGGSTCTIIAIVDDMIYSANVGDSKAVGAGLGRRPLGLDVAGLGLNEVVSDEILSDEIVSDEIVSDEVVTYLGDTAWDNNTKKAEEYISKILTSKILTRSIFELTVDQKIESFYEYERFTKCKPAFTTSAALKPEILFKYDLSTSGNKYNSQDIFEIKDGILKVAKLHPKRGYYKNVSNEPATIVLTPSYAKFTIGLAMPRSLGDFYLATFGVTHRPEITCIKLEAVKYIVLCSDGVWDNWKTKDVFKFITDAVTPIIKTTATAATTSIASTKPNITELVSLFMQQNAIYSRINFGNQSDNATGIIININLF